MANKSNKKKSTKAAKAKVAKKSASLFGNPIWVVGLLFLAGVWAYVFGLNSGATAFEQQSSLLATSIAMNVDLLANAEMPTATPTASGQDPAARGETTGADPGQLFMTPVEATRVINQESAWLIAEPGVLLDNTATFDRGSSSGEHFVQCPEGGFAYISAGHGTLDIDGFIIDLPGAEGRNHIVIIRCRIDDGLQDTDLNLTIRFTGYTAGNVITSPMPRGAYVSADWTMQQLEMSAGVSEFAGLGPQSGGNCGASGCSDNWVHTHDVNSDTNQLFFVDKTDLSNWELQ